ncbi:MAG: hypothetical protein ABSG46_06265 [Candidatus Binataceae bacterium]|jgi:hypothetical protein
MEAKIGSHRQDFTGGSAGHDANSDPRMAPSQMFDQASHKNGISHAMNFNDQQSRRERFEWLRIRFADSRRETFQQALTGSGKPRASAGAAGRGLLASQ